MATGRSHHHDDSDLVKDSNPLPEMNPTIISFFLRQFRKCNHNGVDTELSCEGLPKGQPRSVLLRSHTIVLPF